MRFGIFNSALFATVTTDASCGAVNSMHDSFTPLGGLIPLFEYAAWRSRLWGCWRWSLRDARLRGDRCLHRRLDGRANSGVSREKKWPYDVKMASFVILILAFSLLGFAAWAAISQWGPVGADGSLSDGTNNSGPHGFAEILYAFSSATGNNGSAFAGARQHTPV